MTLSFSKATTKDIPILQEIARLSWKNTYTSIISEQQMTYMLNLFYSTDILNQNWDKKEFFYIVIHEKTIKGFISISYFEAHVKINKLYILPLEKGQGIGKFLIDNIIKIITEKSSIKKITLNVNRQNAGAIYFYKKNGFYWLRDEDNDIGNGFWMNDYVLEKILI